MNSVKTFILISLMTAVLVTVGFLWRGEMGVVIGLAIGLFANVIGYFFSDSMVLANYSARVVSQAEAPELYAIVHTLAQRAGLPMPRIAIIPEETPNAFATGRNPEKAVVAVTEGIMRTLNRHELEGVIAHELGHVKNRDILVGSLAAVLAQAIMFISHMAGWLMPRDEEGRPNVVVGLLIMILGPLAAILLQMAISRSREYMADAFAAEITGRPDQLASALARISGYNEAYPLRQAEPATAHMMICNPLRADGIASLFSTHPPIARRIERLNAMAIQMR